VFEQELRKIETRCRADEKNVANDYSQYLQSVIAHMQRRGDDFGLRPAKAELKRFQAEGTVPAESGLGTPELIDKGRTAYRDGILRARTRQQQSMKTLAERYEQKLRTLEGTAGRETVEKEIGRISQWLHADGQGNDPGDGGGDTEQGADLEGLPGRLVAAYVFESREKAIQNLAGRGQATASRLKWLKRKGGYTIRFEEDMSMLKVPRHRLGGRWTLVAGLSFPAATSDKMRVLASHGFRKHHVVIDEVGELGVYDGSFAGCGYNVKGMRGWHQLGVVVAARRTVFVIDGKIVGTALAACSEPVTVIGNQSTGRVPWNGGLADLYLWPRALSADELKEACARLSVKCDE